MITEKVTSFIPDAIREAGNTIAAAIQGGSGGSSVEWSQIVTTGTKIATITIDEQSTEVYAPAGGGGGSSVSWNEIQTTGTKIAQITIDETTYDVYAPDVSVSASDVTYDNTDSGLTADNVQEAVDELADDVSTLSGAVGSKANQSIIAPVETSTTASQAYAVGEQFILNGVLYTATAAITAGGTITIDGNCTASDTVTEQIHEEQFNVIGTMKSLLSYTSSSDPYKFPNDGYCTVNATAASSQCRLRLVDALGNNISSVKCVYNNADDRTAVFVRKGMQAYVDQQSGTVSINYVPLTSYAE